jgi:hypothetical protein
MLLRNVDGTFQVTASFFCGSFKRDMARVQCLSLWNKAYFIILEANNTATADSNTDDSDRTLKRSLLLYEILQMISATRSQRKLWK